MIDANLLMHYIICNHHDDACSDRPSSPRRLLWRPQRRLYFCGVFAFVSGHVQDDQLKAGVFHETVTGVLYPEDSSWPIISHGVAQ